MTKLDSELSDLLNAYGRRYGATTVSFQKLLSGAILVFGYDRNGNMTPQASIVNGKLELKPC